MKACIVYISSRSRCIKLSLKSLWENYNHKYDYPVYVHYFDDIYDSEPMRAAIRGDISENIHFISVPYNTPSFLKEEELFYNRKDIFICAILQAICMDMKAHTLRNMTML